MQYWQLFVKACAQLCVRRLTRLKILEVHNYLKLFCMQFVRVNGKYSSTPNMRLDLHLSQCLLDFGPVYGFWCFSFEQFNGALGKYPTNQKHIEAQLMKKCLLDQALRSQRSSSTDHTFYDLFPKSSQAGGCLLSASPDMGSRLAFLSSPKISLGVSFTTGLEKLLTPKKECVFESDIAKHLRQLYCMLYPRHQIQHFSLFYLFSK